MHCSSKNTACFHDKTKAYSLVKSNYPLKILFKKKNHLMVLVSKQDWLCEQGSRKHRERHRRTEWKSRLCYRWELIRRPLRFSESDCISTLSGEVSCYVHSSCSTCCELMSDYSPMLNTNTAKPELYLSSPKAILCFLSYQLQRLWRTKLEWEINMFGLIPSRDVWKRVEYGETWRLW